MARDRYYYEVGGAIREEAAPRRRRQEEQEQPRKQQKKGKSYDKAAEKADLSRGFDFRYTLVLVFMIGVAIAACAIMITVHEKVESKEVQIEALQEKIKNIEDDNIAVENKLDGMYSLEDIYTIATGELGMVYSENGSILYYDQEQGDYVKQYGDVPKTTE